MARARGERFKVRVGADRAIVRVGAETPVALCSLPISLHRASLRTVLGWLVLRWKKALGSHLFFRGIDGCDLAACCKRMALHV